MKKIDLIISNNAPNVRDAAWLQPVDGGFCLKIMDGGVWKGLKLKDEPVAVTSQEQLEQLKSELIGSVQDKKTANTINGAKALAKEALKKIDALTSESKDA